MPYQPLYTPTPAIGQLCIEIGELIGQLPSSAPIATSVRLHGELRISTIHSSLMIEGNRLTTQQVTALLDGRRVLGPAEDILAAQNAEEAYRQIGSYDPMNEDDLLRAHHIMMRGILSDAGQLRSGNVGIFDGDEVIHMGALARVLPEVMQGLFSWLRETAVHPLVASCLFHCELELIHPFSDGNGRIGRLWQTVILMSWRSVLQWLPVETLILDRQKAYYDALAQAGQTGSDEAFVEFMLTAIRDALMPFANEVTRDDENPSTQSRIVTREPVSRRKRAAEALRYFAEHEDGTIAELTRVLGTSQRTAERLVTTLRNDGLLRREGSRRAGRWIVVDR